MRFDMIKFAFQTDYLGKLWTGESQEDELGDFMQQYRQEMIKV